MQTSGKENGTRPGKVKPSSKDSFVAVAKRLECDHGKVLFEKKPGKFVKQQAMKEKFGESQRCL